MLVVVGLWGWMDDGGGRAGMDVNHWEMFGWEG